MTRLWRLGLRSQGLASHLLANLLTRSLWVPAYLPSSRPLSSNLAGADFCIESCGVKLLKSSLLPFHSHSMPWQAKSECVEHHQATVERIIIHLLSF